MDIRWLAASACGAALLLGACSGNNASGGGNQAETGIAEDADGTDTERNGPEGNGAEPTPLERAEDEYSAARSAISALNAAVTAHEAANTQETRDAVQAAVNLARMKLNEAVEAAEAAVAAAEGGSAAVVGAALRARSNAIEYRTAQARVLANAESSVGWSGGRLVEVTPARTTVAAVRNRRQDADGDDASTLLKAEDIPAVMYEAGKIVLAGGDRLRMRGIPVVYSDQSTYDLQYGNKLPIDVATNQPNLVAGLQITGSGLVVDIGGKNADGRDFRLGGALDTEITRAGTVNGYDLKLSFGSPTTSPTGDAEHYWIAALMPTSEHTDDSVKEGDQTLPLGTYVVRLSNYAGVYRGLEDANDPVASARDDVYSYLSYAAYGFMDFRGPDQVIAFREWNIDRVFPFHVGYDAFADRDGMKVTDVADADKITRGRFKGRTIAAQVDVDYWHDQLYLPTEYYQYDRDDYGTRLRGDIELTATISGTAASNKISGTITNLEQWDLRGFWEDYTGFAGNVTLSEGDITDSGSFSGDIPAPDSELGTGKYQGNFYGPLSDLEAAGIWFVKGDYNYPIVGSFGAKLAPAN